MEFRVWGKFSGGFGAGRELPSTEAACVITQEWGFDVWSTILRRSYCSVWGFGGGLLC